MLRGVSRNANSGVRHKDNRNKNIRWRRCWNYQARLSFRSIFFFLSLVKLGSGVPVGKERKKEENAIRQEISFVLGYYTFHGHFVVKQKVNRVY